MSYRKINLVKLMILSCCHLSTATPVCSASDCEILLNLKNSEEFPLEVVAMSLQDQQFSLWEHTNNPQVTYKLVLCLILSVNTTRDLLRFEVPSYETHFSPSAHSFVLNTALAGHSNLRFSTKQFLISTKKN
jgi:hypothetical protein